MQKIILAQINYIEDHSEKILPLGILSVGSALKKAGFMVEIINLNEKEIQSTARYIASQNPVWVGLSVMTGIQTEHSALLSQQIKALWSGPIVWGGIHPSLLPSQCLAEDYIDYVIISEGEITSIELTKKLLQHEDLGGILGLGYKHNNVIKINPERPFIQNLDEYRLDFSLIDLEKFIFPLGQFKRAIAYKASRGCPFNCAFCYNHIFNKNRWRAWSIEAVVEDILFLKTKYKIDAVKFYDDNFFVNKNRAFEILEKINLPSHLEVRIDSIDEILAQKLKEFKVFDMLIGVESGSNRLLEMIDKKITVERIMEGVKVIADYDLPATYSAIVGLPTETKAEFESTIDLFYQIYKIHHKAVFSLGAYLPYPGSKMYDFALEKGFKAPVNTVGWGKIDRFRKDFKSPWVNAQKVWRIREYFKFLNLKLGPLINWFEFRIKERFFACPIDIYVVEFLAGVAIEQKGWLGKMLRRGYNLVKKYG
ncbi:MAG TPA: radical SAM protein [bacterium]|nr:radical SAM protein [bacterium]